MLIEPSVRRPSSLNIAMSSDSARKREIKLPFLSGISALAFLPCVLAMRIVKGGIKLYKRNVLARMSFFIVYLPLALDEP
jgi:hypothetical protein